jgi:hypothetical protein
MHLMTIAMGSACGRPSLSGPPNTICRASSNRAEVTCPACLLADGDKLRTLVWDMLSTMGPSREALGFAVRAGKLGVRGPDGRPLVAACMHDGNALPGTAPPPWHAPGDFAADRPDRHADLDAGENGGAMTDADFYDRTMQHEDGDFDSCEPTL